MYVNIEANIKPALRPIILIIFAAKIAKIAIPTIDSAIGSVANYFSEHGWQEGQIAVQIEADDIEESVFNVSLRPSSTVGEMRTLGVKVNAEPEASVSPMKLLGKEGAEYWLGFNNFYVITRYNHSKLYAMAVFQLSEALRDSLNDQIVGSYR